MNEKRNDRQQGGMQRDPKQNQNQPGRKQEDQDRSKTGQVGQPGQPGEQDREQQGQRGFEKGQPQQKPGRKIEEDVEE